MNKNDEDGSSGPEYSASGDEDRPKKVCQGTHGKLLPQDNLIPDLGTDDSNQSGEEKYDSLLRVKRRIHHNSDSDEDSVIDTAAKDQNKNDLSREYESKTPSKPNSQNFDTNAHKINLHKSRLRIMSTSGDESDSAMKNDFSNNDEETQSRIESKRNKLRKKFKDMHNKNKKKTKFKPLAENESDQDNDCNQEESEVSHSSNDEASSIKKIKQKIKENTTDLKSSLYDLDTSDEESSVPHREVLMQKSKKSIVPTSLKPHRMSAKQAMENMKMIKSESNRMLREKEVSLPYHRPKALTLKDIMSRRRTAVTVDGKALPIKMNDEQLKQYAQILEQRQREVIELCKSDTEEEEEERQEEQVVETIEQLKKAVNITENLLEIASLNDTSYDDLSKTDQLNSEQVIPHMESKKAHNVSDLANPSNNTTYFSVEVMNTEIIQTVHNINDTISKTDDLEPMFIDEGPEQSKLNQIKSNKGLKNNVIDKNNSMEMGLVYNDVVQETDTETENNNNSNNTEETTKIKTNSEVKSQLISLHCDSEISEKSGEFKIIDKLDESEEHEKSLSKNTDKVEVRADVKENDDFLDDDMNIEDIDVLIENAEISASQSNTSMMCSPMLFKEPLSLSAKPKLTGAPGMVIDLDGTDPFVPKKLTGVELLKERFVYFSKLKTPEEQERQREKKIKPGMQYLKLKQELEQQIAEQRSLEWTKRLEDEKQHQKELNSVRGEGSDVEDDIDAIETKLEENDIVEKESSSESDEEEVEEELNQSIVDKPRKSNPMIDDEAEESDCDNEENGNDDIQKGRVDAIESDADNNTDDDVRNEADVSEEESSEESEESEDEQQSKPKKGRILKAFEDSDDEDPRKINENNEIKIIIECNKDIGNAMSQVIKSTQDEELHLAQKSVSEDLFTSQESGITHSGKSKSTSVVNDNNFEDKQLGTQTFSILECTSQKSAVDFPMPDALSNPRGTQTYGGDSLDAVVGMCSGSFSQTQNLLPPSQPTADVSVSQTIDDEVLALCTGQFYDNQFVSQLDIENKETSGKNGSKSTINDGATSDINGDSGSNHEELLTEKAQNCSSETIKNVNSGQDQIENNEKRNEKKITSEDPNLKSILDELHDPEFYSPKPKPHFVGSNSQDEENKQSIANAQFKKKFIIDSDEEDKKHDANIKKKKIRKKKLEQRALQISDDEDVGHEEVKEYESELEEEYVEQIVEYDSDENEVAVQQHPKKKRKAGEFFEQEAELTSEDEWAGSGDEDEAGLDRMEREAGDDDTFNQQQLQRELGQIHMRDVLDQDKREVRMIQELLFEDGDLGAGSRQRKFRWKNADGEDPTDESYGEFADTQEEEFESEEQWRKQRHERETYLKTLENQDEAGESLNITMNRTTIIKANLSKNASNLFVDLNTSIEATESPISEKKTASAKDIPSPKKPFTMFQQNYHGSLLTRGRGALARLAALATPLANDDDTARVGSLKPTSKRNFVFTSIDAPTPDENEPKVSKRKAENNTATPKLVKKMRTEDKQKYPKPSLLDHLKV